MAREIYGGTVGSASGGMHRARTEVYAWKEGRYQQVAEIPDFMPENIYFLMLDAHTALTHYDWDKALDLAMTVVTQPNAIPKDGYGFIPKWERYAGSHSLASDCHLTHHPSRITPHASPLTHHASALTKPIPPRLYF